MPSDGTTSACTAAGQVRLFPKEHWVRVRGLFDSLERNRDRRRQRPAGIAYDLDDAPPAREAVPLSLQQLGIQSIYFLLPGLVATAAGVSPGEATAFLCLSLAALGLAGLIQQARRGPFGSGYAICFIPAPVFVAPFLTAVPLVGLHGATGLLALTGLAAMAFVLLLPRLAALMPTEVAGVVVFLIGASLLPRALGAANPAEWQVGAQIMGMELALGTLAAMILVSLLRGGAARFGVLVGAALGTLVALPLGLGPADWRAMLEAAPWFALPIPQPPDLREIDLALLPAFLLAALATAASMLGDLVAFQRAADGAWTRPDVPPIRRGLLGEFLAMTFAGLAGAMAPSSSSACVGLSIATRTLARRVVLIGCAVLLLLACSPKLVTLFILVPAPVQAAMLGYVCCFMMAAGCRLITARMLDSRRTFVVGLGLAAGLGAVIAPELFGSMLPRALASPVTLGTAVALVVNLLTRPLVAQQAGFTLEAGPGLTQAVEDRIQALGGAWGARWETMEKVSHALMEMGEVLGGRDVPEMRVQARFDDDQVTLAVQYDGPPVQAPAARPDAADLDGPLAAQEAFAMWLATRRGSGFTQRHANGRTELRIHFD
jgi:NCS2 family nucleobase:cation symporter-2